MKKIILTILILIAFMPLALASYTTATPQFYTFLGNNVAKSNATSGSSITLNVVTGVTIAAANEKMAFQFTVPRAMTITDVDFYCDITGSMTGILLKAHIETDNSGVPSGVTVGTGTGTVAAPVADGFFGLTAMGASVNLSMNTQYWLVIEDGGGTAPTGSNFITALNLGGTNGRLNNGIGRKYNGSDWTTVSSVSGDGDFVLKNSNGNFFGQPFSASGSNSATSIHGTTRYGIKYKVGGKALIAGAMVNIGAKTGTPTGAFEVSFYADSTLIETISIPVSETYNARKLLVYLTTPYQTNSSTNYYVYVHQAGDAGSSSNRWLITRLVIEAAYSTAVIPTGWDTRSGTTADPTGWTPLTTESAFIFPFVMDVDDYGAATSGSTITFGGTSNVINGMTIN